MSTREGHGLATPLLRLIAVYLAIALALYVLTRLAPTVQSVFHAPEAGSVNDAKHLLQRAAEEGNAPPVTWLAVVLAMAGALTFSMPVAWTYTVTKREEGYDRSVVQTIVMLPVAVAAVVLVVFGSLSLAFALAGIVAAVRFRTTLKDVKDGVFAFVAIGIGIASGAEAWLLAGVLSFTFSLIALFLWWMDLGAGPRDIARRTRRLTLAEALAVSDTSPSVRIGEPSLLSPLSAEERDAVRTAAQRVDTHVRADELRGKGKYKQLLLVYTPKPEDAESFLEILLEEEAERWRLLERVPGREGMTALAYLLRLEKHTDPGDLLDRLLDQTELIPAVELKAVKGLRAGDDG